jgi:hypothetical protein
MLATAGAAGDKRRPQQGIRCSTTRIRVAATPPGAVAARHWPVAAGPAPNPDRPRRDDKPRREISVSSARLSPEGARPLHRCVLVPVSGPVSAYLQNSQLWCPLRAWAAHMASSVAFFSAMRHARRAVVCVLCGTGTEGITVPMLRLAQPCPSQARPPYRPTVPGLVLHSALRNTPWRVLVRGNLVTQFPPAGSIYALLPLRPRLLFLLTTTC